MRPAGALGLSTGENRTWTAAEYQACALFCEGRFGQADEQGQINLEYRRLNYQFFGAIYSLCLN